MPPTNPGHKLIYFDKYKVDVSAGHLFKRGVKIKLRDQSFSVLATLLETPGEVITREQLRHKLWPEDTYVDFDNSLNSAVSRLRTVLNDSAGKPRFIETLPRRGYRFVGKVTGQLRPNKRNTLHTRLVVLPFLNLGGNPSQEYFSDAITDELITALVTLAPENLGVIARTTAMRYKHTRKDAARIGRELSVDYLVEGSVRHQNNHLLVNIQLIRAVDQMHLFANRYETDLNDMFTLWTSIAEAIAGQIGIEPKTNGPLPARRRRKPTEDTAAYNLYIQGRFHMAKENPESMAKAKQFYEEAISRDPHFALAYDALADLYWYFGFIGAAPSKDLESAGVFYAIRALEIDNSLAETHALLGNYQFPASLPLSEGTLEFSWETFKRETDRALELNPTSPLVRLRYAMGWLLVECRLDEAIAEIELALESDPQSIFLRMWLGIMFYLNRQYDRAIEQARMIVEFEPTSFTGYWGLGAFCPDNDMFDEAIASLKTAVELSGGLPLMYGWFGLALGRCGRTAEAREVLNHLYKTSETAYVPPSSFAWTHLGLGEIDDAFIWMDRAVEGRDRMMIPMMTYPFLDSIRDDPRYIALLRKMHYSTDRLGTDYRPAGSAKKSADRPDG